MDPRSCDNSPVSTPNRSRESTPSSYVSQVILLQEVQENLLLLPKIEIL